MTITTPLNLLHFVYKYVVLFCESSSADTACKFLEVFFGSEVAELFQKYASEESTDLNFDHLKLHLLNVGKKGWLVQHGSNGMKNELTFFVN